MTDSPNQAAESRASNALLWGFAIVGGIATIWFLNRWLIDIGSQQGPAAVWPIAAVLCGPVVGVIAWKSARRGDLWLPGPLVPVVLVLFFGVVQGAIADGNGYQKGLVAEYCKYGAVSQAQLDGCRERVSEDYVRGLDTNAARFAERKLDSCLEDAGPYCEDVVQSRAYDDQRPGPNQ